ncbi:restriction endonuclease subunit S [Acinetobacter modestus]|uniref:restriction endonuclease subunit S n=1 Tax=Acinetobacter modestus TaxID=1776740 RepID=UPI001F4B10B6|nr:restriction endonuclease subunit S [Acinetobacter modestus]MCH7332125.1 restriction endonuclease subunit S [Acinetobacter modestus]
MVPKGWIKAPVQDFGHVSAGRQRSPNFTKGTLRPYLRVANVFENYIDTTDVNEMMFTESEYQRYKLDIGDILLNEGQSTELVGRPAMYVGYPENCCFQNTLVRFKADHDKVDASYALQRFLLCLYDGTFQAISKKTTSIAHLGVSRFAELNLLWPPLVEQQKITQILSTWDKAISTTEKLLENSQQQKKALMQELLTGKKRVFDENGRSFSDTWKTYKLGQLFNERVEMGRYDLPLLSITADDGVVYQEETGRKNTSNEDKSKYRRICVNDIGYNTMRMWQGRSSLSDKDGIVSPAYTIIIPSEKIVPRFAAYLFKLPKLVHVFYRHSQGLVSDTWNLKFSHFKEISWSFPCVEEQQKIAEVLSTADQEIDTLQKKLECLKQEKKALMQQLLTGKKRVKVAV